VEGTPRASTPWIAAVAVGAAVGALVVVARTPHYAFLPNAHRVFLAENALRDGTHARVSRYLAAESSSRVLERIRGEAPLRFERETQVDGRRAWIVTIPRTEGYRAIVSFPPARQVTVVEGAPSSVEVLEYRSRGPIDSIVEWVRRPLGA
jgi:hypothetical protein